MGDPNGTGRSSTEEVELFYFILFFNFLWKGRNNRTANTRFHIMKENRKKKISQRFPVSVRERNIAPPTYI